MLEKILLTREAWLWVFGSCIAVLLFTFVWRSVSKIISLDDDYQTRYPRLGQRLTSKQIRRFKELAKEDKEKEIRALIRQALDKEIDPDKIPMFCFALFAVYKNPDAYKKIPDIDDVG